jgi:hypothetical protein
LLSFTIAFEELKHDISPSPGRPQWIPRLAARMLVLRRVALPLPKDIG